MPPPLRQRQAAQRTTGGHADEHAREQQRIEAAAGRRHQAIDQRLVRHQRRLETEVEQQRTYHQQRQQRNGRQPGFGQQQPETHQRHCDRQPRHRMATQAIGETSCKRRSQCAGRAGDTERTRRRTAQPQAGMQHQRQRRPERAEAHCQQRLAGHRTAQLRLLAPQRQQRTQQRRIAQRAGRCETRQRARHHRAHHRHRYRGQYELRAPTPCFSHHATDHARQQDTEQQAGHHPADDLAALCIRRQHRSGGHDVLCQRGHQPDQQAGHQQARQVPGHRCSAQCQCQQRGLQQDQGAAVEAVAQRRQQENAKRIPKLGQGRHQAGGALACAEVLGDQAQHRLAVVQRGDREAGAGRHCQHQRGGGCGRGRGDG